MIRTCLDIVEYCELWGDEAYPLSTPQACAVMRRSGADIDIPRLHWLIKNGELLPPHRDGRAYSWHPEDCWMAIELCEARGWLTPAAIFAKECGTSLYAVAKAKASAEKYPYDPDIVIEVIPGCPSLDVPAIVTARELTVDEAAARDLRISEARSKRNSTYAG